MLKTCISLLPLICFELHTTILTKIVLISCIILTVHGACPPNWVALGDNCFFFSPVMWDFETQRTMCKSRGGELASIYTREEMVRRHNKTFV